MPITITMPALSPTMETGTLARWLVKPGDTVKSGDIIAEIETDKATMEVEAVDEGTVTELHVSEGAEDIKVGAVIATLAGEGEDATTAPAKAASEQAKPEPQAQPQPQAQAPAQPEPAPPVSAAQPQPQPAPAAPPAPAPSAGGQRIAASPLARRVAQALNVDLATLTGTGPSGRIVKADVESAAKGKPAAAAQPAQAATPAPAAEPPQAVASTAKPAPAPAPLTGTEPPFETVKLSNMRRTIARRLTESKSTVPHFYLTVDVRLDALLKLRTELNGALAARNVKLSVNDLLLKALAQALMQVPDANVSFAGDSLRRFSRADISVAVAIPGGLITPVIRDAAARPLSAIATDMKDLAARAREGKLQPSEYTGGTASLSNLGMYGIKQFDAVINPPEAMILAVGAGEQRPYIVDGQLGVATVMSATGSFDHRAIDGATGAELMAAFKALVEFPLGMLA
jgi:pyruvate dehydrogenase E2 component (dihydrolipoamide acetyltransferase)